ncbi:MAG: DUF1566 domain-containing protein, partial [Leptospiraceae bacterium]|nr:DUF1566 domain-containing protein [Leptospiraceae bacterium]
CSALNSAYSGNGYAVIKTWRLPTRKEIETIYDYSATVAPFINGTAFPATVTNWYWSSTIDAANTTDSWTIDFSAGQNGISSLPRTNLYPVRCVSGPANNPTLTYTDNGDGTVKDNATGLIWQKCNYGKNNDSTCSGTSTSSNWLTAVSNCAGLGLAGRSWRLPNIQELKTLVDHTKASGSKINTTVFPAASSANNWSSTSLIGAPSGAWAVLFGTAISNGSTKGTTYHHRCVTGP